uniref:Uncharacterized protein n=1 Tax=Aegilops tauschii subsp. strangulata TaxID=200361 RepID=A0A453CFC4_AEGTS
MHRPHITSPHTVMPKPAAPPNLPPYNKNVLYDAIHPGPGPRKLEPSCRIRRNPRPSSVRNTPSPHWQAAAPENTLYHVGPRQLRLCPGTARRHNPIASQPAAAVLSLISTPPPSPSPTVPRHQ